MGSNQTHISFRTSLRVRAFLEGLAKKEYRTLPQEVEMAVVEWFTSEGHRVEYDDPNE